jgi:hypothetical protein
MGKLSKQKRAVRANGAKTWSANGKNPHVLDMKFESSIHKLVYLDLCPNRNLTFQHIRPRSLLGSRAGGTPQKTTSMPVNDDILAW